MEDLYKKALIEAAFDIQRNIMRIENVKIQEQIAVARNSNESNLELVDKLDVIICGFRDLLKEAWKIVDEI